MIRFFRACITGKSFTYTYFFLVVLVACIFDIWLQMKIGVATVEGEIHLHQPSLGLDLLAKDINKIEFRNNKYAENV